MLHLRDIGRVYRQVSALASGNTFQSLRSIYVLQSRNSKSKGCHEKEKQPEPLMDIKCKSVVFTCGCTGIGFAAANQFLCEGANHVFISGMNMEAGECAEEKLQKKHGEDKATFIPGDVRDDHHLRGLFEICKEKFEHVDIFINDAAILEDRYWKHTVDTNMAGVLRACLLGTHYMGKNELGKGGVIVNLSSIYGLQPLPGAPVFSTTKYAVIGITTNLGEKFIYHNTCVRVVALCPGLTDTPHIVDVAHKQYNEEWGEELQHELEHGEKQPDKPKDKKKKQPLMDIQGKVAIITGGSSGIGLAAADQLLNCGAEHVFITSVDPSQGKCVEKELNEKHGECKATFLYGDVMDDDSYKEVFEAAIERYENVDILFNNAGILRDKFWKETVDINLTGSIRGCFYGFKYMGKNEHGKGGIIINCSSIVGLQPLPGAPVYSSTKYGIIGLTKNLGDPFHSEETGIRVAAVCPGLTETVLVEEIKDVQYKKEWGKEADKFLQSQAKQPPEALGKAVGCIVKWAPSGTIWVVEECKLYRADIPDYTCYSKLITELK